MPAAPLPASTAGSGGFVAVTGRVSAVAGGVGMATSLGGGLVALPWQTTTAGRPADIGALVAAGTPVAHMAVRASLRTPAIALLVTTLLDLAVALISGQPAALQMVAVRAVMGIGTAVLGMIAGNKSGKLRQATGLVSALTGLVMTGSMLYTARSGLTTPGTLVYLIPSVVTQVSSLVVTVKVAVVALRRQPRATVGGPPLPAGAPAGS
jgi:hypothetical protein